MTQNKNNTQPWWDLEAAAGCDPRILSELRRFKQQQKQDHMFSETLSTTNNHNHTMENRFSKTQKAFLVLCAIATLLCLVILPISALGTKKTQNSPIKEKFPTFPSDFVFGAATAAYQIEGAYNEDGKGPNIWDTFTHTPGKIRRGDTGDVADDHYHKVQEDIELAKKMNLKNYRMSISWSRIMSNGTKSSLNQKGIDYYRREIAAWNAAGINVYLTLYHWDLPQYIEDKYGGWLNTSAMVQLFTEYADTCFQQFGDRVKHWITFNEPWVTSVLAYGVGVNAPGRCTACEAGNSATEPYIVAHTQLLAHAHTVQLYRTRYQPYQRGTIGITLNSDFLAPYSPSEEDVAAAQRQQEFSLGWFADPVFFGDYPQSMKDRVGKRLPSFTAEEKILLKGSSDFLGINHYTSQYVTMNPKPKPNTDYYNDIGTISGIENYKGEVIGPPSEAVWLRVVPWGIRSLMNWIRKRYDNPIVYITENGVPVPKEDDMPLKDAIEDDFRLNYLNDYLTQLSLAIKEDKCNVKAYFVWSLLDNFEWADGYSVRFGVHYVDYKDPNLTRYAKKSSKWYAQLIQPYK